MGKVMGAGERMTLYSLSLQPVALQRFSQVCVEEKVIPGNVLIDVYLRVAEEGKLEGIKGLKEQLSELAVFTKLIQARTLKDKLHKLFKLIINRDIEQAVFSAEFGNKVCGRGQDDDGDGDGDNLGGNVGNDDYRHLVLDLLPNKLAQHFERKAMKEIGIEGLRENLMRRGMELGEFLCDAGWFAEGAKVLSQCMFLCLAESQLMDGYRKSVKCMEKLLSAQVSYSMHSAARVTFETATLILKKLEEKFGHELDINLAGLYSAFSGLHYLECDYGAALEWSVKALQQLIGGKGVVEPRLQIDILRQCAKACVVKREFHKAELLVKEAVYLARDVYGAKSVKYGDALLDFGYYLLNRDSVQQAISVYRECFEIRKAAFGQYNLLTAVVMEDLSYALYVKEYSTGTFDEAKSLSHQAISVMNVLLAQNHLQLASAKRVKALILEEIAIDSVGQPMEKEYLKEAEKLHLQALRLSKQVFGEMNVQIAKHYGNLGRLYQSMRKYSDAEAMHLKAISIKESILGLYDFEVALSVGHLASLYNYDMEQYRKAEQLHLRSISIGKRLFGDAYSGLEYDYRGLLQIYTVEGNQDKLNEYSRIFTQWKMLRDLKSASCAAERAINPTQSSQPVAKVITDFFSMKWINSTNTTSSPATPATLPASSPSSST